MDWTQTRWQKFRAFFRQCCLTGMPLFLLACSSAPANPGAATSTDSETWNQIEESASAPKEPISLTPELMYNILLAEVAGQRGQMGIALDMYRRAAESVESPALAARYARIATYSRDRRSISAALDRWLEVDPDQADVYIMKFPFFLADGQDLQALNAANEAIARNPDKTATYLASISEHLSEMREPEQALKFVQRLDAYQQENADARFAYAQLAAFFERHDEALETVNKLLAEDDEREAYLVLKAEVLQRKGEPQAALEHLENAARKDNASTELRFTYGKLLGETGRRAQAKAVFEELHDEVPENHEVLFALGLLALEDEDGEAARSYFSELLVQGDPGNQASYFMGLAEELNGNTESALMWFASVSSNSQRFDAAQSRYINLLAEKGQVDKAREHLQRMRDERPERAVDYYLFEAGFLREQDMPQATYELFNEALKKHPANIDLLYGRAMIAESLDKLQVVEEDLSSILVQDPQNAQALNALGYTLTDRTDRHQEALVMIERALELKPGDPYYLDSLGWVWYRLGDLEKAERYLREAVEKQSDTEFLAHLGEVLWERGKKQQAKQVWAEAEEADSDNKVLKETLRRYDQ